MLQAEYARDPNLYHNDAILQQSENADYRIQSYLSATGNNVPLVYRQMITALHWWRNQSIYMNNFPTEFYQIGVATVYGTDLEGTTYGLVRKKAFFDIPAIRDIFQRYLLSAAMSVIRNSVNGK